MLQHSNVAKIDVDVKGFQGRLKMNSKEALSDLFFLAIGDENHTKKCKEVIEKELKALEIIKECSFVFVENGQLKSGRYADIEILLDKDDFETKEDYELLKEVLKE